MNLPIPILSALIGVIVLFFGRRLFWLCVAAVGFAAGAELAPHLIHEPKPLLALTIAVFLGFVGAFLAIFLQKIAVAVAGFIAGGKLAVAIGAAFFVQHANYSGVTFLVGGVVGALLLLMLFDWALIFLSATVGAYMIQNIIVLPQSGSTILFIGLAAIGVIVQAAAMRGSRTA